MEKKIFVTQKGYELLLKKKEKLVSQLRVSQFDKGRAAAGDSNSWHDNAEFEIHAQNEMSLAEQVAGVMRQIEESVIVEAPQDNYVLNIGHVAVLRSQDGKISEYIIVGFGETNLSLTPKRLSYDSPMTNQFIGKSVGYSASIIIKGEPTEFTLEEIRREI